MRRRSFQATVLAAAVTLLSTSIAHAATQRVPASASESPQRWFVELAGAPSADGRTLAQVRADKAAFRAAVAKAKLRFKERRAYDTLFNGFSAEIDARDRAKLAALPGVKALYPVMKITAPEKPQADQVGLDMAAAINLTGANVAQNQLGLSGQGIKVGIIDTGIDIDHPAFGGTGTPGTTPFPSARVVAGYDFVGDAYDSSGTGDALVPRPDPNPDDCGGHGSHVAGIVGGNGGGVVGVAPKVSFGAYRVFGCNGTTDSDIILQALERAYADGMQVINQSLGAGRQWPQYPTAQASSRLVAKGVVMVASIGNNGPGGSSPDGLFAAGAPGVGDGVIGVASFDNAQRSFKVGSTPFGYNAASPAPLPPTSGSLPLAKSGTTTTTDDFCAAQPAGTFAGQAVLIRRGSCSFYIKAINAQNAGAAAVVLYNNAAGALNASVAGTPPVSIPVVGITAEQGAALDAAITAGGATLNWSADTVAFPYGTGGLISSFSSFGLTAELGLKPNIGAPGGGILSAYPLEAGALATLSGTSMSAPHVAGGVALILQDNPKIPANQMMARLQNSADPKNWSGNASLGFLDHTFRQGAGMLDIVGTIQQSTMVLPSQISLGESQSGPRKTTLRLINRSGASASYTLSAVSAVAAGPNNAGSGASYAPTGIFLAPEKVSFSATTVNVPARGVASVDVTIAPDASLPERSLYGGYVVLTPADGGPVLRVPYAGLKGDYQSTQVLVPTANGFPWLAALQGTSFSKLPDGASFTLANGDIPYFLAHLDHLSKQVKFEAFDSKGRNRGRISVENNVTRNSTPGGFFTWAWDGTVFRGPANDPVVVGQVPNGTYTVKMSVLKALGDPSNAADWETWTSPPVTIARP